MRSIGITLGEPCGIGPELVARTVTTFATTDLRPVVYGSPRLLNRVARDLGIDLSRILFRPAGPDLERFDPEDRSSRAESVISSLDAVSRDAQSGELAAVVTAPIDKSVVRTIVPSFVGHTEYLRDRASVPRTIMLLDNTELRVALLTTHVPLRQVPDLMSARLIEETVWITVGALCEHLQIARPRLAIAALNPHAGETSSDPEEERVFRPAIEHLRTQGFEIEGPFPADTLFAKARGNRWDVVISPYHDQGLVAAKYPGLDKVVNITLGLPYLRVSPGHGVAYDLVGMGNADTRSFERALRIAAEGRWVA
ncbi:MAG: 4-hydroxythreonine-4-phosphate dehydrogenase PdxA [Pseudomonadota bacterium]